MTDDPMTDRQTAWNWIRFRCPCGYTKDTLLLPTQPRVDACRVCGAIVVGEPFTIVADDDP